MKLVTGMQEIDIVAAAPIILDGGVEEVRAAPGDRFVYRGRNFQARDVFDLACVASAEPEEIATVLAGLTFGHLDDLELRLEEMAPILEKELADKVDAIRSSHPWWRDVSR